MAAFRRNRPDYLRSNAAGAAERHRLRMAAKGGRWARNVEATCEECGAVFLSARRGVRFCSPTCRTRPSKMRRRAAMSGAPIGPSFTTAEIWIRDGHRCKICGKRVRMDLAYPHPFSPSLDHVVPLAMGGRHEADNVQLTHLRCNLKKGTRQLHAVD